MLPRSNVLITKLNPASPVAESFRLLRTFLKNSRSKSMDKGHVFLITSAEKQEGKSTVLANLAVSLAQDGNKVLIIDCHLRSPSMHQIFNLSNPSGLTELLKRGCSTDSYIKQAGVEQLYLLPSGSMEDNPSELLSSEGMELLLEELKLQFTIILLDTPPVLSYTDAQVLSSHCDGAALVVKYGKSNRDAVHKARTLLESSGCKVLGVIINQTEWRR